MYYAYNRNRPADSANFIDGTGTTGKRANAFAINLAALDLALDPRPVGARLTLVAGNGTEVIHGGEPDEPATGPDTWRFIYQAYLTYKVTVGKGLIVDAGVYPCHVGMETFLSKDNWSYTRSWLGEFSPYYVAGVRATYSFTSNLSAQLHVVNGWQIIGDNNDGKTVGTQVAWSSDHLTLSFNTMAGPELAGDNTHRRELGDTVVIVRPNDHLSLGANVDFAVQQLPGGRAARWRGYAGYVRLSPVEKLAIALRGEIFNDPDGGISGTRQRLHEATATIELKPVEALILKLEGRHDISSASVFREDEGNGGTGAVRGRRQSLVVLSAVATF